MVGYPSESLASCGYESWSWNSVLVLVLTSVRKCSVVKYLLLCQQTLGIIRVPLHTMEDGDRGFPVFLAGKFIGNSKKQLIDTILKRKIMPAEAVEQAVQRAKQLTS